VESVGALLDWLQRIAGIESSTGTRS